MKAQRRRSGFTFWELMIVLGILTILAVAILPALRSARSCSIRMNCTNNLRQVGLAFKSWALDQQDQFPWQVSITNGGTMELSPTGIGYIHFFSASHELNTPWILICPTDTNRFAATNWHSFRNNYLSYFVGIDADDSQPETILSGDDNLTIDGVKSKRGLLNLQTNAAIAWTAPRHVNQGNVGFADGSVQSVATSKLPQTLVATGLATNRLILP